MQGGSGHAAPKFINQDIGQLSSKSTEPRLTSIKLIPMNISTWLQHEAMSQRFFGNAGYEPLIITR